MEIKNILQELKNAPVDKGSNIKHAKLTGDENLSIFAAEVNPRSHLNPHYHKNGIETYQIYSGSGIMKTGTLDGISVTWKNSDVVTQGDFFSIPENTVHQIVNDADNALILIFSCPAEHLSSDRHFVAKEETP